MYGKLGHPRSRWSLTPPSHPYHLHRGFGGYFLLHYTRSYPRLPVRKHDALCCPDFPPLQNELRRQTVPLFLYFYLFLSCFILSLGDFIFTLEISNYSIDGITDKHNTGDESHCVSYALSTYRKYTESG